MDITISKIAALALAVAYSLRRESRRVAWIPRRGRGAACRSPASGLRSQWGVGPAFGDGTARISPSPAWLVATMGWVLLVGIPLFALIEAIKIGR